MKIIVFPNYHLDFLHQLFHPDLSNRGELPNKNIFFFSSNWIPESAKTALISIVFDKSGYSNSTSFNTIGLFPPPGKVSANSFIKDDDC